MVSIPDRGVEDYYYVNENKFSIMEKENAFSFSWMVNGIHYGVPIEIEMIANSGRDVIFKGSRNAAEIYLKKFPQMVFLELVDDLENRKSRLKKTIGGTANKIEKLLSRKTNTIPQDANWFRIYVGKSLDEAVEQSVLALNAQK